MDDAFLPGTLEVQLHDEATVLMVGGALKNKRGVVHLTNDRLFFNDQRFNPSLAGGVAGYSPGQCPSSWRSSERASSDDRPRAARHHPRRTRHEAHGPGHPG